MGKELPISKLNDSGFIGNNLINSCRFKEEYQLQKRSSQVSLNYNELPSLFILH